MPQETIYQHSEEVHEIITAVPSWILRRGIALIFLVLLVIILLSALIRYPDIVKTSLKVNSLNAPKEVIAHQAGKLTKILVKDNQMVKGKTPLAFIESTANHYDVIALADRLNILSKRISDGQAINPNDFSTKGLNLGELQGSYQTFYQEYLQFINTQKGGFYLSQKAYLQRDLAEIKKLQQQIIRQREVQQQEFKNVTEEYEGYKKLKSNNVISNSEFKQQENKYLSGKYPLQQTTVELLNNNSSYLGKQKELASLDNTIKEQQTKFVQALSSMINETEAWLLKYVVSANMVGRVSYVGILQENQNVVINQELFVVNPGNTDFFGEVQIPQLNMGKVKKDQRALIKMSSYPFEQYGLIRGRISYVSDVAFRDSVFMAKVSFNQFENKDPNHKIILKNGMRADIEIITQENSLLERVVQGFTKLLSSN